MWPLCILLNKLLRAEEGGDGQSNEYGDLTAAGYCRFSPPGNDGKPQDTGLRTSQYVEVPHIHQLASWDCGLACVLMVLRTIGITSCDIEELTELCSTNSIWTVDLAYLLHQFCVEFSYFTITFGANPNYSVEAFYKEQLPEDLVRVDMLFRKAQEAGINIQCRSICIREISRLILSGNYVAIALVDQYKLSKSWLEEVIVFGFNGSSSSYTGHYIVICGYDAAADEFEIRDPASSKKNERISSRCLENARKSFGTDEDVLLISLEKIKKQRES